MKTILLLPLLMAAPVLAGTSAKQTIAPAPNPCLTSWFAGASVGYLTELEEPMYNLHVGVTNSCWNVAGWNISLFAEVGYADTSESYNPGARPNNLIIAQDSYTLGQMGDALQLASSFSGLETGYDLDIVPITFNVKFERPITGNLNAYLGAGIGIAWVGLDLNIGPASYSDSDWVFAAQVFGGLSYTFTPNFEMYGGARWIYYANPSFGASIGSATLKVPDDCLLELGARYKF